MKPKNPLGPALLKYIDVNRVIEHAPRRGNFVCVILKLPQVQCVKDIYLDFEGVGFAKRRPTDEQNDYLGTEIAYERARIDLLQQLLQHATCEGFINMVMSQYVPTQQKQISLNSAAMLEAYLRNYARQSLRMA